MRIASNPCQAIACSPEPLRHQSLPHRRRKCHPPHPKTFLPPLQGNKKQCEPTSPGLTIHPSRMVHSRIVPSSPRLFPARLTGSSSGLPRVQPHLGYCLNLLCVVCVLAINSLIFCFFQRPKCFGPFVFTGFQNF